MKARSGDEEGICLQVGKNWSSRHLSTIRAGAAADPGTCSNRQQAQAQPAHSLPLENGAAAR